MASDYADPFQQRQPVQNPGANGGGLQMPRGGGYGGAYGQSGAYGGGGGGMGYGGGYGGGGGGGGYGNPWGSSMGRGYGQGGGMSYGGGGGYGNPWGQMGGGGGYGGGMLRQQPQTQQGNYQQLAGANPQLASFRQQGEAQGRDMSYMDQPGSMVLGAQQAQQNQQAGGAGTAMGTPPPLGGQGGGMTYDASQQPAPIAVQSGSPPTAGPSGATAPTGQTDPSGAPSPILGTDPNGIQANMLKQQYQSYQGPQAMGNGPGGWGQPSSGPSGWGQPPQQSGAPNVWGAAGQPGYGAGPGGGGYGQQPGGYGNPWGGQPQGAGQAMGGGYMKQFNAY